MSKRYPIVLSIAGSDSVGGAGIQADIKAISATGSYAATAITAVTVQNTLGVEAVHPVPPEIVEAQINCVLNDIGADAVKIGMLHSAELIRGVKRSLKKFNITNIVLDPVMVSTSGHRLLQEDAVQVLINELIPMARIITPNIPEAEILLCKHIDSQEELKQAAIDLSAEFSHSRKVSVLMKAGHVKLDSSDAADCEPLLTDVFYNAEDGKLSELPSLYINTRNTHGTGCTLSSAIASYLAQGESLENAVRRGKTYIANAIKYGAEYEIGHGHGPVNHFWGMLNTL
ncbi:MAG: bifunctional hydroxymethylpyrimidine kinase/phosphomethylpyrimidine kinase [Bacteroidales bacterium]|nr:bifunctional hydroxymethylpyrimidine kinase/phosphomethylpyrimidine kinase [Candidatus Egerieousia equi]